MPADLPVFDLSSGAWMLLAVGALLIGIAKTALPGLATVAVAMFAAVLPAKQSTAVVLLLLLVGDLVAVWIYRREVDWAALRKLVPPVLVGVAAGVVTLRLIDDAAVKRLIGVILLLLTAATIWLMWRSRRAGGNPFAGVKGFAGRKGPRWLYGGLGGYTTMVANSGGPPMTLYFLASGFNMLQFLGTQAWFFFFVNLTKVPLQAGLGFYTPQTLSTAAALAGLVLVGTWLGRIVIRKINPDWFNPLILLLTVGGSLYLMF